MTPFEAGIGTGIEAVIGTGTEARGVAAPITLFVFMGIDEREEYTQEEYDSDLAALLVAKAEAEGRGVALVAGVVHYESFVQAGVLGFKPILPAGEEFPRDHVILLAEGVERSAESQTSGEILESPETWLGWVRVGLGVTFPRPGSRVVFALDTSGSMHRNNFLTVPEETSTLVENAYDRIETEIVFEPSERWPLWPVMAWTRYLADHPDLP